MLFWILTCRLLAVRVRLAMSDDTDSAQEKDGEQRAWIRHRYEYEHGEHSGDDAVGKWCAPTMANANPVQFASLYAVSCASRGAFVPSTFNTTPSAAALFFSVALYTTVEIARPNAVPSCVSVWKSAPPTLCSCGRQLFATNSVPVENTKSAPKTHRIAAGKPKAQYGAEGTITAKSRLASPVPIVPMTGSETGALWMSAGTGRYV